MPFFATDGSGTHDYDSTAVNGNIRTVNIPNGTDAVWAYFGCFLDVYDAANNSKFPGTHHCIVAQIAYDDAPIINSNGVTMSPENSDKLAQRNLQITTSGNPGPAPTHRIPQAFDLRPSKQFMDTHGNLTGLPDELMIDWGNTPVGAIATIYLPQVNASDVLKLATALHGPHNLTAADANTIQCKVVKGATYIPIPAATGKNFAGLFTVDLPIGVRKGQEFNIIVRRAALRQDNRNFRLLNSEISKQTGKRIARNWRYITGTFQVRIPVTTEDLMLQPEENTLAIMKWRLQEMPKTNRWYPVLKRYASYVAGRVDGSGGNSAAILPSRLGAPAKIVELPQKEREYSGKICRVHFDCFGDFQGFTLCQCCGESVSFASCEKSVAELALRACRDRMTVTVYADHNRRICRIVLQCC